MATYIQTGNRTEYKNPSSTAIACGEVVVLPARAAVAITDIPAGGSGTIALTEAFSFPTAAESIPLGTPLYWDATAKVATKTDTNNTPLGIAITPKSGSSAGTVTVRLE